MKNPRILYATIFILFSLLIWIIIRENYVRRAFSRINNTAENNKTSYWLNRDDLFETFATDSNSIIFLGTSLTQQFELAELFQNTSIKNRGIVGDLTKTALLRLKPIVRGQPAKIFIELGINDILENVSEDTILGNYSKILDTLLIRSPRSQLYVNSILPVNSGPAVPGESLSGINTKISHTNSRLQSLCSQKNVIYLNTAPVFAKNGVLNPSLTFDGVHLNGKAYLLWRDFLKPYVEEETDRAGTKKIPHVNVKDSIFSK